MAYTRPHDARSDYRSQWGGEELDYLSRYDGLRFIRINPFGAWCLGLADTYVAVEVNLELVPRQDHARHRLAEGDRLEIVTLVGGG